MPTISVRTRNSILGIAAMRSMRCCDTVGMLVCWMFFGLLGNRSYDSDGAASAVCGARIGDYHQFALALHSIRTTLPTLKKCAQEGFSLAHVVCTIVVGAYHRGAPAPTMSSPQI